MKKICKKCKLPKDLEDFSKSSRHKDGYHNICKICLNEQTKSTRKASLDKYRAKARERYWKDPEKARLDRKKAYNPISKAPYDIIYRANNQLRIAKYKKDWEELHKDDPLFKLRRNLRRRIHHVLADGYKSKHTQELIGCTFQEFKSHIENKFQEGMTWENYGKWHLDHIKPCCEFDLTKVKEQLDCFNYKNQQPLWATENLKKGRKWQQLQLKKEKE